MSDDDLGLNFTDTWMQSAPAPAVAQQQNQTSSTTPTTTTTTSQPKFSHQKLNRKEKLEQKRVEKQEKKKEQREIAKQHAEAQKLLKEEEEKEQEEGAEKKPNPLLASVADRFAVSGNDGGSGLSLMRQEKKAQQQKQQPQSKSKEETAAAKQAKNKTQQQPQTVKKYESFVRDKPASSTKQQDEQAAKTQTTRSPFDDKKTSSISVTKAFEKVKEDEAVLVDDDDSDDDDQKEVVAPPSQPMTMTENLNRKQRRQRQREEEEKEEQEQEEEKETEVIEETVPQTEEILNTLHRRLKSAITEKLHFSSLTYVQRASFNPISNRQGGDVVIRSETGSGKTLAYSLPLVNQIVEDSESIKIDRSFGTLMIVMVPTRELAEQCSDVITKLVARSAFVIVGCIHGGDDRHKEKSRLRKGIHVLVSTPGRLLDHLKMTNSFTRDQLRYVVLDEADRLLDMGFERAITDIMNLIPKPKKRVLVSATVTNAVERLKHFVLEPPLTTVGKTEDVFEVPDTLIQRFISVPPKHRLVTLAALLWSRLLTVIASATQQESTYTSYVAPSRLKTSKQRVVCFVSTSDAVEFLYLLFSRLASPFYSTNKPKTQQKQFDDSFGGAKMSVKKMTEEANQHLGNDDGGNGIVDFDDEDGFESAGMDPRVARAQFGYKQQKQAQEDHANKDFVLSDEDAFLRGANIFKLHGNMSQVDRQAVYENFKKSECAVLFCTDVAARGLDIPNVDLIVHYDPPIDERSYVHRVGRTARIGTKGESILFMMPHELAYVNHLSRATRKTSDDAAPKSQEDEALGTDSSSTTATTALEAKNKEEHKHEYSEEARPKIKLLMPEMNLDVILFQLSKMDRKAGPGRHWVHSAAFLQRAMCDLARYDPLLRQVSLFAYQSYVRAYAGMPREVKRFFDQRQLHLGQIASSFANMATPIQLQRDLKAAEMARRERRDARDANKIRFQGASKMWDAKARDGETYHSTLMKKAMFETKNRVDEGTAGGMKAAATASKAITEFEA